MKRPLVLAVVCTVLAAFTFACSDDESNKLENAPDDSTGGGDITGATDKSEPAPAKTSTAPATPAKAPATTTKPATTTAATCDVDKTTTKADCAKCCATKAAPTKEVNTCACGAESKCKDACAADLCTGGNPGIQCGFCLLTAGCNIDFGNAGTEAEACLDKCADKP